MWEKGERVVTGPCHLPSAPSCKGETTSVAPVPTALPPAAYLFFGTCQGQGLFAGLFNLIHFNQKINQETPVQQIIEQ